MVGRINGDFAVEKNQDMTTNNPLLKQFLAGSVGDDPSLCFEGSNQLCIRLFQEIKWHSPCCHLQLVTIHLS